MSQSKQLQQILNASIQSITSVLPLKINVQAPAMIGNAYDQKEISVIIGLVGDVKGRMILDTTLSKIGDIGEAMFGMKIEGEMVESFCGELGNMIAGNLCTLLEKDSLTVDISPPTVMVGTAKISGFQKAIQLPLQFDDSSTMHLLLTIEDSKV